MVLNKRIFFAVFAAFLFLAADGESAENAGRIGEFLKRTPLPAAEQADILNGVEKSPDRTEWLISGQGEVYSIVLRAVQKSGHAGVRAKLEELAKNQTSARAHLLLYLYVIPEERKARYTNEESVAEALAKWDSSREDAKRLKPDISVSAASGGWAFALLKTRGDLMDYLSGQIEKIPVSMLDTAYCAALYPKARAFFDRGEYEKALPVYRELHTLRWAMPSAYLDAAECFSRVGDRQSAAHVAKETVTELADNMNCSQLERAGDILFESGEDDWAERSYRLAIDRLRQER